MRKIRVTIKHNPNDSADDLRVAARVRRDLWAHSPVEVVPDSSIHGTRRDEDRNAYFEFATNFPDEVDRVIGEFGYASRANVATVAEDSGPECSHCGNNLGSELPTVCRTCGFRDITPCAYCGQEIARQAYIPEHGDVFRCPNCHHRVRLRFADPLFDSGGECNQPLIVVDRAEG